MNDVVNVAHVAGKDGKCARCGAGLGTYTVLDDDTNAIMERPWKVEERVIEYECPDGRNRFADWVAGVTIDCIP